MYKSRQRVINDNVKRGSTTRHDTRQKPVSKHIQYTGEAFVARAQNTLLVASKRRRCAADS